MSTAQTSAHAEPSMLEKLASQVESGLRTPLTLGDYLRSVHVPKDKKNGHDDVNTLINEILTKGKEYAIAAHNDPNKVTPTYTDISNVLKTDGAIENGKLSDAAVTQILGRYASQGLDSAGQDYNGNVLRLAPDASRPQVAGLAKTQGVHDVAAEVEKSAKTPEDVARLGAPGMQDLMQKAQAAYSRGRVQFESFIKGFKESIAHYGNMPAYAGAHK